MLVTHEISTGDSTAVVALSYPIPLAFAEQVCEELIAIESISVIER